MNATFPAWDILAAEVWWQVRTESGGRGCVFQSATVIDAPLQGMGAVLREFEIATGLETLRTFSGILMMRLTNLFACWFVAMFVVSLCQRAAAADQKLDPARLKEVEYMAHTAPDDSMYLGLRESMGAEAYDAMKARMAEKDREREDFVRNAPGITPYLFFLLDREYADNGMDFVSIMVAISKRKDLTEEDVDRVTARMDEILDTPIDDKSQHRETIFLIGGVIMMRSFPSAENEDLVIRVLTKTDDDFWWAVKQNAAETLSVIGTKRSLPYLESTQKWAESRLDYGDHLKIFAAKMKTYQRNLKRRLEDGGHGRLSTALDQQGAPSATVGGYFLTGVRWLFVSLVCLGLAVVGGVYFRKRTGG